MLPIKTILCPTDFSERSDFAFKMASSLARDHGARLIVLHVVPPPQTVTYEGIPVLPPMPVDYKAQLEERLHQYLPANTRVRTEVRLEEGFAATEIVRVAEETDADLIVMGTHGRTGLGRLLLGSIAEEVLRRATCPVLTVKGPMASAESPPKETPEEQPHTVLVS
jgi:nucleotide-binding universal stress UspA family protein